MLPYKVWNYFSFWYGSSASFLKIVLEALVPSRVSPESDLLQPSPGSRETLNDFSFWATKTFAWPPRNDHLLLIYADEVLIRQFISLSRLVLKGGGDCDGGGGGGWRFDDSY